VVPFQNCVQHFKPSTKMDAICSIRTKFWRNSHWMVLRNQKRMKFERNLLLWNYSTNLNQTLLKWSLGGPLQILCLPFQTPYQDGRHAQI
jgi:hypothetical protein